SGGRPARQGAISRTFVRTVGIRSSARPSSSFPSSAWERKSRSSASSLSPVGDHVDQPRQAPVISGARIPRVRRAVAVPPPHCVIVHVVQLLDHHLVTTHVLRVTSFLPELVAALGLVPVLVPFELPQQRYRRARL